MGNDNENPLISLLKETFPYLVTGAYAIKKLLPVMLEKDTAKKEAKEFQTLNEIYDDHDKLSQRMYSLLREASDEKIKQMASDGNEYAIDEAMQRGIKF